MRTRKRPSLFQMLEVAHVEGVEEGSVVDCDGRDHGVRPSGNLPISLRPQLNHGRDLRVPLITGKRGEQEHVLDGSGVLLEAVEDLVEVEGGRRYVLPALHDRLQGLKAHPNDIDITTDRRGAHTIQQLLQQHVTHSQVDSVRSHLGELTVNGVKIETIGDIETRTDNRTWTPLPHDHLHTIMVAGAPIPVGTLEQEAARANGTTPHARSSYQVSRRPSVVCGFG